MGAVLKVFPHRSGPWLVRAGRLALGVPPGVGAILQPLNDTRPGPAELGSLFVNPGPDETRLVSRLSGALHGPPRGPWTRLRSRLPVWLRIPLLPAAGVAALARPLICLTGWPVLATLAVLGITGVTAGTRGWPAMTGGVWLAAGMALLGLTAVAHELGHAAALVRSGYQPGGLGLGLLAILPVFFVDVTPVALLSRRERLRVNAAGPVFQLALAGLLNIMAQAVGKPGVASALHLASASALLAAVWSLWPFLRSDGYWLVCDTLSLPGLDQQTPAGTGKWSRVLADGLRLANMVFYAAVGVIFWNRAWGGACPHRFMWPVRTLTACLIFTLGIRILRLGRLVAGGMRRPGATGSHSSRPDSAGG